VPFNRFKQNQLFKSTKMHHIRKQRRFLFILYYFEKQPDCGAKESQNTIPLWEIALIIVGSVVGVTLLLLAIVLIVPSFRSKIFPLQDKLKKKK